MDRSPITRVLPLSTAIGALGWLALVALRAAHRIELGIIEILFSLAPLVIVPLGLELIEKTPFRVTAPRLHLLTRAALLLCALVAVTSFFLPVGIGAALATVPWLLVCLLNAVSGSLRIFRHGLRPLSQLCCSIGQLYLPIGGIWFLFSRIGARPLGFYEPIVLLTAVHFHYAGFAAAILAGALLRFLRLSDSYQRWALNATVGCVLVGPALLAAGFLLGSRAKLAAALVVVIGEIGLATWTLPVLGRVKPRSAQIFLALSAVSGIAAMLFAGLWAVGEYPFQPMLNIPQMAQVHGTINAVGFVFCGVFGWTLHVRYAQPQKE
jgi:hypothetical protein